jgi:hypothetical protein
MGTRSILENIFENFLQKLSDSGYFDSNKLDSLRNILFSDKASKEDIMKIFKEALKNENS